MNNFGLRIRHFFCYWFLSLCHPESAPYWKQAARELVVSFLTENPTYRYLKGRAVHDSIFSSYFFSWLATRSDGIALRGLLSNPDGSLDRESLNRLLRGLGFEKEEEYNLWILPKDILEKL